MTFIFLYICPLFNKKYFLFPVCNLENVNKILLLKLNRQIHHPYIFSKDFFLFPLTLNFRPQTLNSLEYA